MKLWKTFELCAAQWKAFTVSAKEMAVLSPGEPSDGYTDVEKCRIYVLDALAPSKQVETFFHEVLHAVEDASGLAWLTRNELGITQDRCEALEEMRIRVQSPALLAALRSSGMLRGQS